jgi:PAS domain S-box-containing protein
MNERNLLVRPAARAALFTLGYAAFYRAAYAPLPFSASFAPIWPVTGYLLAVLLLTPRAEWWRWLGLAAVASTLLDRFWLELPARLSLGVTLTRTAQVFAQAALILRLCPAPLRFERRREVFVLLGVVAGINVGTTLLSGAIVGSFRGDTLLYMRTRWISQTLTAITIVPILLTWAGVRREVRTAPGRRRLEAVLLGVATVAIVALAIDPPERFAPFLPAPYLALIPVVVAALRFGPRGATATTAIVMVQVILVVGEGGAWPGGGDLVARLAVAQLFLGVVAVTGLLLAASIAENDRAHQRLGESEGRFRAMFETSANAVAVLRDDRLVLANPAFCRLFGAAPEHVAAAALAGFVHAEDRARLEAAAGGKGANTSPVEVRARRRDDSEFPLEVRFDRFELGGEPHQLLVCIDLTEKKRTERELRRINRALRALSRGNHTLIHARDEAALLHDVCRVIIEEGGFPLAWVGYAEHDAAKSVRPVAQAGTAAAYLGATKISWADEPRGQGPTGTAIRTGQPAHSPDFGADPQTLPWRAAAAQHGLRSSVAFPLRVQGEVIGALGIYASEPEAFDAGELKLLRELADDLGFGIQVQRQRLERDRAEAEVRRLLAEAETVRGTLLSILEDRQAAEKALEQSEARYRSAMHNSAIGMALVSLEGRWLEVNPALCQIVGYSREELLARDFQSLTHPADRTAHDAPLRELLDGQAGMFQLEKRYVHRSGRIVWVLVNTSVLRDAAGQPQHFVSQIQDITARRQAEAALAAAAERLAVALRASQAGVWRHNVQTRAVEWDARVFEIFGLPAAPAAPELDLILACVVAEDQERVRRSWRVRPGCPGAYEIRFRVLRRDGKVRHLELHGSVQLDALARPEWIVGVASDITAIVDAAAESERLRAQLHHAQKMETLGTLAAGVAHDFNNLLTGINGFVELASASLGPGHEAAELLKQARRGALNARDLVRRILTFSRSSPQNRRAVLDVGELVRDTAPLLAAALPAHVSLVLAIGDEKAPVLADSGQLQQVLMNLCVNAAHAIGARAGRIEIQVQTCLLGAGATLALPPGCTAGRHVRLAVRDNGAGMDAATRARLFEPFFTTKPAGEGTGLGLTIVRDIVAAHEGGLEVESELGRGTTFFVFLPLAGVENEPGRDRARVAAPTGRGQRIMIVDDEPAVAAVARLSLQRRGFTVEAYTSPLDAWARFEASAGHFSLLLVDQNMPDLSGEEFVTRARARDARVAILMMSGRFEPAVVSETARAARAATLKKPFEIDELAAAVHGALESESRRDA